MNSPSLVCQDPRVLWAGLCLILFQSAGCASTLEMGWGTRYLYTGQGGAQGCQLQEILPESSARILGKRSLLQGPGNLPSTCFCASFLPAPIIPLLSPQLLLPQDSSILFPHFLGYRSSSQVFTTPPAMGQPAPSCFSHLGSPLAHLSA